ncbi:hypothetical protein C7M84_003706 [Penaeus vannamei]|uniref:Fibronectin type-III domain-containing protein n=1 Tax=Penaeus vannamei TaxID=6689 RepID=A0A423TME1_PENVA|nr:hypothetical protein C7M84_003706 [Penaeus vannamei]
MPANCTIIKESSDLVSLSWAHPLTNCAVYTYNVSWLWEAKWNGSLADEDWDTTGQTSYTISGIRPYSEVLISIKGKTASGYGPALECEALTAEYFPSAPSIVSVTEGSNYLSVTWEPPEEPNGVIQRYRITRIGDDGEEEMQETDGDTLTARVFEGEAPLETVTCDGAASRNFTVMWDHGSVTCKDQYYSITWNSTVKWSADEDQGETEVPGNETAYTFLDATPYTEYFVCVAITKDAEGGVCCDHTTAEDGPSAPVIKEISSFRGDVRISWSPPEEANGVVRNYNVSWESEDADPGTQEFDDVTEGLVVGLEKCHTYTFSVAAGTIVWGNKSETREVEVVNYVDSVTCISGGTDRVLAQYEFATQDCGFNMRNTNWKVNVLWNNNTCRSSCFTRRPATGSFTVPGLEPFSQVEVCMSVPGRDEEKACCSATTDEAVPDEPSEVIVSKVTNTTAHISWTMPLHVNGAIKSWEVTLRGDTDNEETENDVEGEMMFFDATDLTPSTNYEVTVKCQTGGGLSKGTRRSFKTLNADNTGDNQPNIGLIIGLYEGDGIEEDHL